MRVDLKVRAGDLADCFGVSPSAVSKWVSRDGAPQNPDGTFDLRAVCRWFRSWRGASGSGGNNGDGSVLPLREEQALLTRTKRQIEELKLAKCAGELVEVERVVRDVGNLIALVRTKLLQLPGALAHRLASEDNPASVMAILDDEIGNVLNELARARLEDLGGASDPSPLPVDGETDDDDDNTDGDAEPPETAKKARGRKKREVVQED